MKQALHSVQNLSLRPDEIGVVDNAPSSDATRKLVADMPGVRYVLEPRPGLDIARKIQASGRPQDLVAFTHDDVMVHPNWIGGLKRGFLDPTVLAVTGLVLPAKLETEAQFFFETYWGFNSGYYAKIFDTEFFKHTQDQGVPVWEIGAGANMAFRPDLTGEFNERLDLDVSLLTRSD